MRLLQKQGTFSHDSEFRLNRKPGHSVGLFCGWLFRRLLISLLTLIGFTAGRFFMPGDLMFIRSATEQTVINASGKVAAGGSVTALGSGVAGKLAPSPVVSALGLTLSDFGVIVGIIVAVSGLAAQIYFLKRRDKRETALHNANLAIAKNAQANAMSEQGQYADGR